MDQRSLYSYSSLIMDEDIEQLTARKSALESLAEAKLARGFGASNSYANPDVGGSNPDIYGSGQQNVPLQFSLTEQGEPRAVDLIDESEIPLDKPDQRSICEFGSVYKESPLDTDYVLSGGSVVAGTDVHAVANATVPSTAGTYYAYVPLNFTVNTDDDGDFLLSGIASSNIPNPILFSTGGYPAGTDPTVGSPSGSIALPLGVITVITDRFPIFARSGCGSILVSYCPGTVSIERGIGDTDDAEAQIQQNTDNISDIITILESLGVYP